MKLYIPSIGDQILLSKKWLFKIYNEHRNISFVKSLFPDNIIYYKNHYNDTKMLKIKASLLSDKIRYFENDLEEMTHSMGELPAKTLLKIDRIYIRKGNQEFDSISFLVLKIGSKDRKMLGFTYPHEGRFWVKLEDANNIEFTK